MNMLKNYFFNIDNGDGVVADGVGDGVADGAADVVTYDAAEVTTSSDDEDFNEESFIKDAANNHAVKYQNLLQRNKAAKLIAKIMLTERKTCGSEVWDYFGTLTLRGKTVLQKQRFCNKACFDADITTLKGFSVGTSTLNHINHLRTVHSLDISSKRSQSNTNLMNKALATSLSIFKNKTETNFVNARRIAEMCCTDLQPFNIVERKGFQKYISTLKPNITFPRSRTIATTALND
ncbi:hypothetical protein FF38_01092, partial [Lucilia cuprina]